MPPRTGYLTLLVLVGFMLATPGIAGAEDARKASEPAKQEVRYRGKPTSYWIKKLELDGVLDRREAVKALATIGPEGKHAIPALVKALQDDDADVREGAIKAFTAFEKIGPAANDAIPILVEATKDKDEKYRMYALGALGAIGLDDKAIVLALGHQLRNKNEELRHTAIDSLLRIGPGAIKAAVPDLLQAMKEHSGTLVALELLYLVRELGPEAVPIFIEVLKDQTTRYSWGGGDPKGPLRGKAAEALGAIGPAAREAVPALTEALKDKDEGVREYAKEALEKINKKQQPIQK